MKPFTREEEACFKTALALVIVKKRLLQQHDDLLAAGQKDDNETNSVSPKRRGAQQKDSKQDSTKRVRTMESLMFPWSNKNNKNAAIPMTSATGMPHQPQPTKTSPNLLTQQRSQQHKAHVQTMMATALRTAMRLIANVNSNNNNQALWTTLGGLTTHLAHQLSLSMSLVQTASATALPVASGATTRNTDAATDWVKEWARENLQQQLVQTQNNASSSSPSCMIQATFLVWRGILLDQEDANNKMMAKTTATQKDSSAPHRAACRNLFVEVFCDVLQKEGILVEPVVARNTVSGSRRVARSANVHGGRQQKMSSSTSVSGKATVSQKRAITPPPSQTIVRVPPRPRHAWQRVFSAAHTAPRHHRGQFRSGSHAATTKSHDEYLFNLWLVHGLQLLQQVMAATNHGKFNQYNAHYGEDEQRPSIFHRLHPELFLPPVHMTQWYVDTVDRRLEQQQQQHRFNPVSALGGMQKTAENGVSHIGLDPGAKLMSMVALCQALKDEHQTQTVRRPQEQRVH